MSVKSPPGPPTLLSKLTVVTGFVCFAVGALALLYVGGTVLKRVDQLDQNERNLQRIEMGGPAIVNNNPQLFKSLRDLAGNSIQMARTNLRVSLALGAVSLFTLTGGGVLLFSVRPRR